MEIHGMVVKLIILFSFILLVNKISIVKAAGQTERYQLMDDLFATYKPEVRPTTAGEATYVYIALYLLSIQNLDEKNQVLQTSVYLEADWVDDYLSWDPASYDNLTYFMYPQKKIWLPDLVVSNSVNSQSQLGYDENQVLIDSSGLVTWYPSEVIETSCDIDVTYYPFDTQKCSIVFSTWVSTKDEIDVDPDPTDAIRLDDYSKSGTWELVSTSYKPLANEGDTTRLQFTIKMRRLRTFYILNIITPVLLLSFTASMVFFLPADAGEKMGMSITVLLAYAVYLTIIADNMPQTSLQVSILAVYLTSLLGVTALAVVVSVIVLHMHFKPADEPVGQKTVKYTRIVRNKLKLGQTEREKLRDELTSSGEASTASSVTNTTKQQPPTDTKTFSPFSLRKSVSVAPFDEKKKMVSQGQIELQKQDVEEEITWQKVAQAVDRVFFFITSALIALLTVIFLLVLAIGGYAQ